MIAPDQKQLSVQLLQDPIRFLPFTEGKVSQDHYLVVLSYLFIPLFDHMRIHLLCIRKTAHIHTMIQIVMIKMAIRDIVTHRAFSSFSSQTCVPSPLSTPVPSNAGIKLSDTVPPSCI